MTDTSTSSARDHMWDELTNAEVSQTGCTNRNNVSYKQHTLAKCHGCHFSPSTGRQKKADLCEFKEPGPQSESTTARDTQRERPCLKQQTNK